MEYVIILGLIGLMLGMVGVASNPSPYFGALGLVMSAAAGCWVLVGLGMSFLSLVLFLIYLGGMLVVFAYSAAMAAEPYPEAWGNWSVAFYISMYLGILMIGLNLLEEEDIECVIGEFSIIRCDWGGVSMMYCTGGLVLLILGWVLLMTLFVVLELIRVIGRGAVCAV
uniref:NADH-ubiquinone oxidoreductase chain 6 n=1 Tax=Indotyphlus maharashtraensis TaxID=1035548 RepID=W5RH58_INDMA|nr:NADH dehydrogenase subunit 6 [Indotyphlus maharashtraensis]AGZ19031.1 NADH dehydrogenase subunit 6 [Indotyphlus maharashtraensis]